MKKRISGLLVLFFMLMIAVWVTMDGSINKVKSCFHRDGFIMLSSDDDVNYLFDTGADITVLYTDTVPESFFFLTSSEVTDVLGNNYLGKKYFSFSSKIGLVEVDRLIALLISKRAGMKHVDGIIGADLIDRSDWWIDFRSGIISNDIPLVEKKPDMVIHCQKRKGLYYADLNINGIRFSDLLIDTGYDRADFLLKKKEMEFLSDYSFVRNDSCFGFTNVGDIISICGIKDCKVDAVSFKDVTLVESFSRRLVGLPFLKRFSYIVFDTRNRKIDCFF